MTSKYKFRYRECEQYYPRVNGKCLRKDEMLWEFDNMIYGITLHGDHYIINHYGKDFDKSEYELCDMEYSLEDYGYEWFDWILENSNIGK